MGEALATRFTEDVAAAAPRKAGFFRRGAPPPPPPPSSLARVARRMPLVFWALRVVVPAFGVWLLAHLAHHDLDRAKREWRTKRLRSTTLLFCIAALCDACDCLVHAFVCVAHASDVVRPPRGPRGRGAGHPPRAFGFCVRGRRGDRVEQPRRALSFCVDAPPEAGPGQLHCNNLDAPRRRELREGRLVVALADDHVVRHAVGHDPVLEAREEVPARPVRAKSVPLAPLLPDSGRFAGFDRPLQIMA